MPVGRSVALWQCKSEGSTDDGFLYLQTSQEEGTAPDAEHCWKAPELLRCDPPAMASDAFAFGMVIFQMLQRAKPFDGENPEVSFCQRASQSHALSSRRTPA